MDETWLDVKKLQNLKRQLKSIGHKDQGEPNLDKADWNNVENAWDELWSSALILICDLADDVLIIHSTRNVDASAFWAKKKYLKFGAWPPDAIQCIEWPCMCRRRALGAINEATPWGLSVYSCIKIMNVIFIIHKTHPPLLCFSPGRGRESQENNMDVVCLVLKFFEMIDLLSENTWLVAI